MVVSRRHPQIVVRNDADLPQGGRKFSVGFGLKMAETRRLTSCTTMLKDRERYHARIVRIIIVGIGLPLIFARSTSQ